ELRELPEMEPAEVAELIQANLGAAAPAEIVEQAIAAVGGNPRFVEEWLRFMLERGRLVRRHEGWTIAAGDGGAMPKGLQALYEARLEGLSAPAVALAERLAIASIPLPAGVFTDWELDALEAAIAELAGKQLLSEGPTGLALLDRQLAAFLAARLDAIATAEAHGALARAIAAYYPSPRPLGVLNALAHHASAGPDPAAARDILLEAARENLRLKALVEAKRFAEAAKGFADGLAPSARIELLEILSTAHRGLDEADAALAIAEETVALAETLGGGALLARSLNGLGKTHQLASRYDDARAAFERAARAATDAPLELARSHRALARLAFFAGDMPGAMQHGREAIVLVRAHAEPRERAEVLAEVGETFQGSAERLQEGLACLEEAQAIARDLADPFLESTAAMARGNLQLGLGQLAAARISFARAASLFESQGNAGEALFARLNLALVAEEQGRFGLAEELSVAIATEARQANRKFPLAVALAVAGSAQVHQGQTREGLKLLEEAVQVAEAIQHKYLRAVIRQLEAPVRLLLGQWDAARSEATALLEFGNSAEAHELVERAELALAELSLHAQLHEDLDAHLAPLLLATHAGVRARAQYLRALA
ncbi:MAG TPA: tetratricopeptide repeat protein, partial [Oscillatoriaceae cyanobacterium]